NALQHVTLTCTDNPGATGCAATYYAADGSTPTTASSRYTGPITIADNATLRYFSLDVQGNAETSRQQIYVIDTVPPTLVASDPSTGTTGVAVTKVVTATFSEDMKASTLSTRTASADHGPTFTRLRAHRLHHRRKPSWRRSGERHRRFGLDGRTDRDRRGRHRAAFLRGRRRGQSRGRAATELHGDAGDRAHFRRDERWHRAWSRPD